MIATPHLHPAMSSALPLPDPQLLRLSVDWLWRCDLDGTVTSVEAGRQALPAGLEALLLGQRLYKVGTVTAADRTALDSMSSLVELASPFEVQLNVDDPTCCWRGSLVGMPERDAHQTLIGFVGSARARQAVQRGHEQQQANRDLDNLYRTLSHDLQNPLNGVLGFSDLLARRHAADLAPDGMRMLGMVRRSAADMRAIVEGMMELHRLAQMQSSPVEVNLSTLIDDAAADLRQLHPSRTASVNRPSSVPVWADLPLLQLTVAALLRRSWLAGPETEPVVIDVDCRRTSPGTIITFADQGAAVDLASAHELFVPLRDPRGKASGHGPELALAQVSRAAAHMNGWVWLDSPAPRGQRVHLYLPHRPATSTTDRIAP